jgi:hypothetical protein
LWSAVVDMMAFFIGSLVMRARLRLRLARRR